MNMIPKAIGTLAFLAATALPAVAQEQSSNRVNTETDWSVFVEDNPSQCWVVSAPKSIRNVRDGQEVEARRGDIRLYVSYWPGSDKNGEVSATGGYPYRDGSTVTLEIGSDQFDLFTDGEMAWAMPDDDAKIVAAMKRGAQAVVTGVSGRGTETQDTFSLLGFTAAVDDAAQRCSG
ncbi:MAG: invasion associated locus B family protein [Pseudomonadota bacterium]